MDQFKFEARQKTVLIAFMILGVVCMGITFLVDDPLHSRFWTNFLHNSVFFTGIAFVSLFVMAAFITAYAGWHAVLKRVWEAYSLFLIPGLVLMVAYVSVLGFGLIMTVLLLALVLLRGPLMLTLMVTVMAMVWLRLDLSFSGHFSLVFDLSVFRTTAFYQIS